MSQVDTVKKDSILPESAPTMRLHLWFENKDGVLFGLGRLQLLRQIEECGSLKKAAEALGMSYRGAWGKIKTTEEALGQKLIERASSRRAGYHLTEFGCALVKAFDAWFQEVESFALAKSLEYIPFSLEKYK